jgi:hypothetical protein
LKLPWRWLHLPKPIRNARYGTACTLYSHQCHVGKAFALAVQSQLNSQSASGWPIPTMLATLATLAAAAGSLLIVPETILDLVELTNLRLLQVLLGH